MIVTARKRRERAGHQLAAAARLLDLFRRAEKKVKEDAAEDLVLLENLVGVEPLFMAQRAELSRFGHDRHVDADLRGRILDVVGDAVDQQRDVVEELIRGKDPVGVDRDARRDPIQPRGRQLAFRRAETESRARRPSGSRLGAGWTSGEMAQLKGVPSIRQEPCSEMRFATSDAIADAPHDAGRPDVDGAEPHRRR